MLCKFKHTYLLMYTTIDAQFLTKNPKLFPKTQKILPD